jgi:hypothetical protein
MTHDGRPSDVTEAVRSATDGPLADKISGTGYEIEGRSKELSWATM